MHPQGMHPPPAWGGFQKSLWLGGGGGEKNFFLGGGGLPGGGGGSCNFEVKNKTA